MARKKWKRKTYSTGQEWDGFRPTAYKLSDRAQQLPIERVAKDSSGQGARVTRTPTTVGDAFNLCSGWLRGEGGQYTQVQGQRILEVEHHSRWVREEGAGYVEVEVEGQPNVEIECNFISVLAVKTTAGEECFCGSPFSLDVLEVFLRLKKASTNPSETSWFYYGSDSSYDVSDSYYFFVVCGDKIVDEWVVLSDSRDNGFDPAIFSTNGDGPASSVHESDWCEAKVKFWYRKFYTESRIGQLMVLRPDEPALYFYPEGRFTPARLEGLLNRLMKNGC